MQGSNRERTRAEAESYGAVREDDELVTHDLEGLERMFRMDEQQSEETGYRPDND